MTVFLLRLSLIFCCLSTAVNAQSEQAANLDKVINLSFHQTLASEILGLISKSADFNLIFPKKLDRRISINIKDRLVKDAIEDLSEILDLNYIMKNNTLIISDRDISEYEFMSIDLLYSEADELSELLNNTLFKQLAINQPEHAFEPYSLPHPGKNTVVIAGNKEQNQAALDFIKELDLKPFIKIYSPSYFSLEEAYDFLKNRPDAPKDIKLSFYQDSDIVIKGNKANVEEAFNFITEHDLPPESLDFYIEIFKIKNTHRNDESFYNIFPEDQLQKINSSYAASEEFNNLFDFLDKQFFTEFSLAKAETKNIQNLEISAEKNYLNKNQYSLELLGQKIQSISKSDIIAFKTRATNMKEFKKEFNLDKEDILLTLIKLK